MVAAVVDWIAEKRGNLAYFSHSKLKVQVANRHRGIIRESEQKREGTGVLRGSLRLHIDLQ